MTKSLGVIGGLGPAATAYFYELISRMTDASIDQGHIDVNIISRPSIPDRTDYILNKSADSPLPHLIEAGRILEGLGVSYIAIPCITAHYFYDQLASNIGVPIIHIIRETVQYLKSHGVRKAGIMATEGTITGELFQLELNKHGISPIIPTKPSQDLVTSLIYNNVKAGRPANMEFFNKVRDELIRGGADTIILGCTELSMIKRDESIGSRFIDALEVLAMRSVLNSGACLKKEYQDLITS